MNAATHELRALADVTLVFVDQYTKCSYRSPSLILTISFVAPFPDKAWHHRLLGLISLFSSFV